MLELVGYLSIRSGVGSLETTINSDQLLLVGDVSS